jgi:hypothetical protein
MIFTKNNPPPGFYVYLYLREDDTPYYCGKGCNIRAWVTHRIKNKTTGKYGGIQTPKDTSRIVIVSYGLLEMGAFILERKFIRWYGRIDNNTGVLYNKTDGGDGGTGVLRTQETRDKISKGNKGKNTAPHSVSTKAKRQATMLARTPDEISQWRANISQSLKGKVTPQSTINKIRLAKLGKKRGKYKKLPRLQNN